MTSPSGEPEPASPSADTLSNPAAGAQRYDADATLPPRYASATLDEFAPAPAAVPDAPPGYAIERELGRGGMGVVYLAWQHGLNRPVALKMVLSGMYASSQDLVRFLQEAEAVAQLRHPNVVQVHEVGRHQGRPNMALEYCDGGSLDRKFGGHPVKPEDAARLSSVRTSSRSIMLPPFAALCLRISLRSGFLNSLPNGTGLMIQPFSRPYLNTPYPLVEVHRPPDDRIVRG